MKVIKPLMRILLKETTTKYLSRRGIFTSSYAINNSWFTINEKFTYTLS